MAIETFEYIDDLNVANPTATDNVSEGDDHLRGLKTTLKNTFPNVTGAINATETELNVLDMSAGSSTSGQVLTSTGTGTVPTWQDSGGTLDSPSITGTLFVDDGSTVSHTISNWSDDVSYTITPTNCTVGAVNSSGVFVVTHTSGNPSYTIVATTDSLGLDNSSTVTKNIVMNLSAPTLSSPADVATATDVVYTITSTDSNDDKIILDMGSSNFTYSSVSVGTASKVGNTVECIGFTTNNPAVTIQFTAEATYSVTAKSVNIAGTYGDSASSSADSITISNFSATGGTITTNGGYTYHTFTSSGSFVVSGSGTVDVLIVGGGGTAGNQLGGGGGGAGVLHLTSRTVSGTNAVTVAGAGGSSVMLSNTATAGGGGGTRSTNGSAGANGGGGGAGTVDGSSQAGGSGTAPTVSGGSGTAYGGYTGGGGKATQAHPCGGGGGANGTGGTPASNSSNGENGGEGIQISSMGPSGATYYWAGGGGGASHNTNAGNGGLGGGGGGTTAAGGGYTGGTGGGSAINVGTNGVSVADSAGGAGGINTGGGGGGGSWAGGAGGNGGSGIVIVRY